MMKNKFPKRKTGSTDGITNILPHYYQQELEIIHKQHAAELDEVSGKLEEVTKRQVEEADRNVTLEANLAELNIEKLGFEKILLAQEQMVKKLNHQVKDFERKCITLNEALTKSEVLNKDMNNKLQEYYNQMAKLMEDNETLLNENKRYKNRLDLEKNKWDLLKQKQHGDTAEAKLSNDGLKKELVDSQKELTLTKGLLSKRDTELKTLQNELQIKTKTVSNQIQRSSVSDVTSKELLTQLNEQKKVCERLQDELKTSRASQHDSGMKLLSSGQCLEQLESNLYRKSAECSALMISKDTMQVKMKNLEEENERLKEKQKESEFSEKSLIEEVTTRKKIQKEHQESHDNLSMERSHSQRLAAVNEANTKVITELKEEIRQLIHKLKQQEATIASSQKKNKDLHTENEAWKRSCTQAQNKLLNVEYEKSDAAKVDLQRENTTLKLDMTRLKHDFSTILDEFYSDKMSTKNRFDKALGHMKHEQQAMESFSGNLQMNLELANVKIQQKDKLDLTKDLAYRKIVHEKGDLQSRIFSLEEKLQDVERESTERENRVHFMECENKELQAKLDRLNSELIYSVRSKSCSCNKQRNKHSRTVSAETYYDSHLYFSTTPKIRMDKIERYDGDGGALSSCDTDTKFFADVT